MHNSETKTNIKTEEKTKIANKKDHIEKPEEAIEIQKITIGKTTALIIFDQRSTHRLKSSDPPKTIKLEEAPLILKTTNLGKIITESKNMSDIVHACLSKEARIKRRQENS